MIIQIIYEQSLFSHTIQSQTLIMNKNFYILFQFVKSYFSCLKIYIFNQVQYYILKEAFHM